MEVKVGAGSHRGGYFKVRVNSYSRARRAVLITTYKSEIPAISSNTFILYGLWSMVSLRSPVYQTALELFQTAISN